METIIVTVTDNKNSFFQDVEVPVDQPVKKLKADLIETLNNYLSTINIPLRGTALLNNRSRKILKESETLQDASVWNGDYITIISRRDY